MQAISQEVLAYLLGNSIVYAGIAFVAGFAANKSVAYEGRSGFFLYLFVGLTGMFLGEYAIISTSLKEWLEKIPQFRLLFDFIAAYIGSFIIAAMIHFIKPH
jgi:uncharacterized membrane protein YeaQ/YmgE (transglycosylase-associated protein family)